MQTSPSQAASPKSEVQQRYLVFSIDGDEYALDVTDVLKVVPFQEVVPIPNSPDFLLGFINLAGDVVPLIDLEVKFRLKREIELDNAHRKLVVIESQDVTYAMLVDSVAEVMTTTASTIQTAPDTVARAIGRDFLVGVIVNSAPSDQAESRPNSERVILVLDAHSLLSDVERKTVDQVQPDPDQNTPSAQHSTESAQVPTTMETS